MTVDRCPGCGLPVIPSAGAYVRGAGCVCLSDGCCQPAKKGVMPSGAGQIRKPDHNRQLDPVGGREGREAGTGSGLEALFLRVWQAETGFSCPFIRQYPWARGRRYLADFAEPSTRLLIEVDGMCHRTRSRFQSDCERACVAAVQGWRLLRFTGADLRQRPGYVVSVVREALREGEEG